LFGIEPPDWSEKKPDLDLVQRTQRADATDIDDEEMEDIEHEDEDEAEGEDR
jgi:hypothetical protein